jgi:tRNA wybutosine-synthesizing protein 3
LVYVTERVKKILHVLTASREHAQLVIQAGMEAGFRETGAVSLLNNKKGDEEKEGTGPIVAVRSMGLSFESLVGVESSDKNGVVVRKAIVSSSYLRMLVGISHERFRENQKRIARFRGALTAAFEPPAKKDWEDAETRRERKRLEGLKKREEVRKQKEMEDDKGPTASDVLDVALQQPDVL